LMPDTVPEPRFLDLAVVGGYRHAERPVADGDRRADHRVGPGMEHRHILGAVIRDVGVLGMALRAASRP
jgi:hypothetical protein